MGLENVRLNEKEKKRVSEKRWMCVRVCERERERPIITFYGLECRNGLSLQVSFHEKIENERRNKGRCKRNSNWLLKRAILPFNQSDFG